MCIFILFILFNHFGEVKCNIDDVILKMDVHHIRDNELNRQRCELYQGKNEKNKTEHKHLRGFILYSIMQ